MLRNFLLGWLLLVGAFSSGCMGIVVDEDTSRKPFPTPTQIDLGKLAESPTVFVTPPKIFSTITPSPLPEITKDELVSEHNPNPSVCSPLDSTPLHELPSIVSDGYHPPPAGDDGRHQGVDFAYYRKYGRASIAGEIVQSVLDGRVAANIQNSFPYGNVVIVETEDEQLPGTIKERLALKEGDSIYVLYAHLETTMAYQIGEEVLACQELGKVGKSGNAGVAHLHLETRVGARGYVFERMSYYIAEATAEERENYLLWRISGEFKHFDPLILLTILE